MGKSIMQDERECFISGYTGALDKHHIYAGNCRKASEKFGCWVWLRHDIHMELHDSNKTLDKLLRRTCQERFEETHSREEFMEIFGKSYL